MNDPLLAASKISASGLFAQSARLRVVSENIANAQSTGDTPGAEPYRRKTISFRNVLDRAAGAELVEVQRIRRDESPFREVYEPEHPAADARGFVRMPNVSMLIELADMREATRTYEANLAVIRQTRELVSMTVELLRN